MDISLATNMPMRKTLKVTKVIQDNMIEQTVDPMAIEKDIM